MQTIKRAAKKFAEQFDDVWTAKASFYEGVKFAQKWISIEDELPQYYQPILADNGEYITVITRVSDGDEDFYPICGTNIIMNPDPIKWRPIELK